MKKIKAVLFSLLVIFSLNTAVHADDIKVEIMSVIDEVKAKFHLDLFPRYRDFVADVSAAKEAGESTPLRFVMAQTVSKIAGSLIKSDHYSCECECGCFDVVEALDPVYHYLIGQPRKRLLPTV